jgi:acetyl-CoA carboxylase biotin carboxyl carrier protein
MKIDKKLIKELVDNLDEFKLSELEYQNGDTKIKVSKWADLTGTNKVSETITSSKKDVLISEEEGVGITSPIIGTVYLAPEPGAKKFIQIGDRVKKGQTIMIVEAMKTMNHIPTTSDGYVKNILVKDGQPVEFGQKLILLK